MLAGIYIYSKGYLCWYIECVKEGSHSEC